ncbi:hypothetical protein CPB84DRAFT_1777146 [Gymnopilus junonius]|uniref:HIT-type domain-containing protein n=1 Tax=Gymnopilus junonius TaxID=109634 RepID=A0A9P5TML2_GYMJU|nr:hypothetical protein CPB84DRAFT_1777146 [Gymnopilus junonius]
MTTSSLHHSLPPKPKSGPSFAYDAEQPEASSSSTPSRPTCAMCKDQLAKYTCPGCFMRTCSAPCSSAHKAKTGCSGMRDKAKYVPMNQYTWGKMMDDYTFLEEIGRKIGDLGREIVRGGYRASSANSRGDVMGRGRAIRGRGGHGPVRTKRDILKMQLEVKDIDMELLPAGMERRKANQSSWDNKNQTALLTVEFKFCKQKDPFSTSETKPPSFTLMTHRNDIKKPLLSLIASHLQGRNNSKKESSYPDWVKSLVIPDSEDPESFTNPQCVMAAQVDTIGTRHLYSSGEKAYHSFDPTQPMEALLRHTHFVEFPTIEIWEEFFGTIVDAQGVPQRQQEERPVKRRRMNPKAGRAAIAGLLGGYGSESEGQKDQKEVTSHGLAALDDYVESEEDATRDNQMVNSELHQADLGDMSDDDAEVEVDPVVLLELIRTARAGQEPWGADDEEAVDWGDVDDDEME